MEILKTGTFDNWIRELRDPQARARILARIDRLGLGNPGDVVPVGGGISEMRIHCGPGYRVYFMQRGDVIAVLLCGGDKSTQQGDISKAQELAASWRDQP